MASARSSLATRLRSGYERWVADYRRFARMRGFETFNDGHTTDGFPA